MKYLDKVFGEFSIDEPVLIELIESATLQRLKNISNAGYFEAFFPGSYHTRFEHSVGDMFLLMRFGAPLPEQIAGLIHDVSHSAFSHCIDYIGGIEGQKDQTHQDNMFEDFVRQSDIPAILQKHGIDLNSILDDSHFPLKETDLPDLCTDRMDYSLRGGIMHGEITQNEVTYFLENITATNGQWIFKNFESALWYAKLFLKVSSTYFSSIESAVMLSSVGAYLKHGLTKKYITMEDIYIDDVHVLAKMKPFHETDSELSHLFERMSNQVPYKNNPEKFSSHVFCKSRVVDPLFFDGSEIKRVSEVDEAWKQTLIRESKPKEYFIQFEDENFYA